MRVIVTGLVLVSLLPLQGRAADGVAEMPEDPQATVLQPKASSPADLTDAAAVKTKPELEKDGIYTAGGKLFIDRNLQANVVQTSSITVSTKLTVPNGVAATDAAAFGQLPTVYQAAVQAVSTTDFSTTGNTYQTTGLSASITPSSAASRVKVTVSGDIQVGATLGVNAFVSLFRTNTSTNLAVGSDLAFCHTRNEVATTEHVPCSFTFIDSPAATSSTLYFVRIKNDDGATTVHFGAGEDQVMILEEIK